MNNFLIEHYSLITHFVEILAAVTGLLLFNKYKGSSTKYFIYFLVFITLSELVSRYTYLVKEGGLLSFLDGTVFQRNYWWGTLFWSLGSVMFYSFFFLKIIKTKRFRVILNVSRYSFLVFFFLYIIINWGDYFIRPFPVISILGAIIIFMCSIFYFLEILESNTILSFYKSINFYIAATIFIWWLIITPIVFFHIYYRNIDWNFIHLKWMIFLVANIFMYLTFTFALIWCKPQND
ncbi:hypothetical protein ACFQ1F_01035 [Flaviramulus multivorans]|uniref:hypothetical protein n=1 Tax=Flaviramulus multivorans TaxID=1304750 RepID=UPI001F247789|nr:hypothetical protein [Flaviramulus multivorans]